MTDEQRRERVTSHFLDALENLRLLLKLGDLTSAAGMQREILGFLSALEDLGFGGAGDFRAALEAVSHGDLTARFTFTPEA